MLKYLNPTPGPPSSKYRHPYFGTIKGLELSCRGVRLELLVDLGSQLKKFPQPAYAGHGRLCAASRKCSLVLVPVVFILVLNQPRVASTNGIVVPHPTSIDLLFRPCVHMRLKPRVPSFGFVSTCTTTTLRNTSSPRLLPVLDPKLSLP